ncbi:hypothetical protein KA005_42560 [bacterium]|nr:hypothetical protein [bacterium]
MPYRNISFSTPSVHREETNNEFVRVFNTNPNNLIMLVQEWLNSRPEKSDVVHDLLAFLAEEMTHLNKEKQGKTKGFLTWLEKEIIKGSIENQKNKTKIQSFHEGTLEKLMDVLKKNKVIPDPCPSNIWNTINAEFSVVMKELTPLKANIEATDKLIDQVVYKLYNLTEDEIGIVEGKGT